MKWSWAGHINRLKDDRWTSRVTTWRPYDKKRRQGRPAKRWRDDLDKYWSDTIWQRTAQGRVTWRQHAEAFAQPRDTTAADFFIPSRKAIYVSTLATLHIQRRINSSLNQSERRSLDLKPKVQKRTGTPS